MSDRPGGVPLALAGLGLGLGLVLVGHVVEMLARTGGVSLGALGAIHSGSLAWIVDTLPLWFAGAGALIDTAARRGHIARSSTRKSLPPTAPAPTVEHRDPIADGLVDGVIFVDDEGRVQGLNPAARRILGLDGPTMGLHIEDLLPDLGDADERRRVTAHGEALGREWHTEAMRSDRSFLSVEVSAIDVDGRLLGYAFRDVTVQQAESDALTDVQRRLEVRAQMRDVIASLRNEADEARDESRRKSGFLAGMAHDLRTPLRTVNAYVGLLQERAVEDGFTHAVPELDRIGITIDHVMELLDTMVDQSRLEAGKLALYLAPVGVEELVEEMATMVRPLAAKNGNELRTRVEPGVGHLHGDRRRVRQVLLTLLGRACARTRHGEIFLAVGRVVRDGIPMVAIRVRDNGESMSRSELMLLLKPLQRTSDPRTRRQLAFGVAAELARLMRGELTYASPTGHGSDFTVFFPVAEGQLAGRVFATGPGVGAVPQVLVVADSPPSADLLDAWLAVEGYEVVVASSVAEAMELATDLSPSAAVVDVQLQGSYGWAALAALKANQVTACIPTLVFTMRGHRAYELRAVDFLLAPVDRQRLVDLAHNALPQRGRVLLVDLDAAASRTLRGDLEAEGWHVTLESEVQAALDAARNDEPDLLICNLSMPGLVGLEVAVQLRDDREIRRAAVIALLHAPTEDERWALTRRLGSARGRSLDRTLRNVRSWIDRHVHLAQGGDPEALEPTEETGIHELEG